MGLAAALLALCLAAGSLGLLLPYRSISGIPQATFDDLVRYTKYSSGAYQLLCVRPLGNTLVESVIFQGLRIHCYTYGRSGPVP